MGCTCVEGAGGEWGTGFIGGTELSFAHWLIN